MYAVWYPLTERARVDEFLQALRGPETPPALNAEVTIAGVVHEYSTLDGVREDVVDLLLNLKGVVFRLHNRQEAIVTLKKGDVISFA